MIQGNTIGTDPGGAINLGNAGSGIQFLRATNNTVGGTAASAANTIAFNGVDGVRVSGGLGNLIGENAIFGNSGLGIDLVQSGNQSQPAPVLSFTPLRAAVTARSPSRWPRP